MVAAIGGDYDVVVGLRLVKVGAVVLLLLISLGFFFFSMFIGVNLSQYVFLVWAWSNGCFLGWYFANLGCMDWVLVLAQDC